MSCMWGVGGVNGFSCCGGDIEDYYRQAEPQLMVMAPAEVREIQSEFRRKMQARMDGSRWWLPSVGWNRRANEVLST